MAHQLSLEEFIELSKKGKRVALFQEFSSDCLTPIAAYHTLKKEGRQPLLLESGEREEELGRSSFIGIDPLVHFSATGQSASVVSNNQCKRYDGHPFVNLRSLLAEMRSVDYPQLPQLAGGAIGFITYDAVRLFEKIPDRHSDVDQIPEIFFLFHEGMIAFNHLQEKVTLSFVVEVGADPEQTYQAGMQKIEALKKSLFSAGQLEKREAFVSSGFFLPDLDDAGFCAIAAQAKEEILKGEAFQIVLSRTFKKETKATPLEIYRALRHVNPSPFMFLIETEHFALIGASPERLASLNQGVVEAMPIAGSCPRAKGAEDIAMEKELLNDEKELAEHRMLIDLARNDLGKVCQPGSIKVTNREEIRRFSHVMHIVSRVKGVLENGRDALDVLEALFPAGTLSGAPKIRAMEIIDSLENSRRGIYGGAICKIDSRGDMDSCIAIRTAFLQKGVASVRAGAGIVFDSIPQKEAEETFQKARAVLEAIKIAEEGTL